MRYVGSHRPDLWNGGVAVKRYLLSYLAAYVASLAAFGVIMVIAISNWFFTDSPLWFDVLGVIVTALPALALGEVLGRRFKANKQEGLCAAC